MLVSVFGTHTPFGYWGFSAVRHVMQVLYGDCQHIHCLHIDELRQAWAERDGRPVVFTSDCPDSEIGDLFISSGVPIFAFLDDLEDAVSFAIASRQIDAPEAIRFSVHCLCALSEIARAPATICYTKKHYEAEVRDIIVDLFEVLCGRPSNAQIEQVLQLLIADSRHDFLTTVRERIIQIIDDVKESGSVFLQPSEEISNLIDEVAQAYYPIIERKQLIALKWPRDLFFSFADNKPESNIITMCSIIELLGPARRLTFGPYLYLPAGIWVVTLKFEISECFSGNRLGADVWINPATGVVTSLDFDVPVKGIFSVDMTFVHKDPNCSIEVRVWLLTGAIEGKLSLHPLSLRRTNTDYENSKKRLTA
jgi:hypothetical protein